jgi:hypothetical protein
MRLLIALLLLGQNLGFCFERDNIEGVEYFLERPKEEGVFPAIIIIHGYQPENKSSGGQECLSWSIFTGLVSENIVAIAISIPGFGGTEGNRDYCGPIAQNAVITLINHLKTLPYIDKLKIGLLGVSRGATTAAMVSTRYEGLAFQVLISGRYDFTEPFPKYFQAIQDNYLKESNGNWGDRSAVYHVDKIKMPTLILHGALDPLGNLTSAQKLHSALVDKGVFCRFVLFPNLNHCLGTTPEVASHFFSFLREQFYNKTGIGISLSPTNCYPQISGFLMGYPAEKSPHLQLGDIILGIAPNNDEMMISTFNMPTNQISNLILGQKRTKLRLKIAHLTGLEEEVIVERT